jgi:hypothetical protein
MKFVIVVMMISSAFAMPDLKKAIGGDTKEIKQKACPVVNGKEDCTVKEVKEKALDLKKKVLK